MATYPKAIYSTPQITTGNPFTVNDATQQNYPLGGIFMTEIVGVNVWLQYVQFAPSSVVTPVVQGAPLYYTDATRSIVSNVIADCYLNQAASDSAIGGFAGVMGNAAPIPTALNFIWILGCGQFASFNSAGITMAKGDRAVLSNAANTLPVINVYTKVAAGTALGTSEAGTVYITASGATAGGLFPGMLNTSVLL